MAAPRTHGAHHVRLTVSDFDRSFKFYTEVLGFTVRVQSSPTNVLLSDGTMALGLNTPWHEIPADQHRFDEARIGLDHLSFRLGSAEEVERAAEHLDAYRVPRSEVKQGRGPGSNLVVFRDPDNIQLEFFYTPD